MILVVTMSSQTLLYFQTVIANSKELTKREKDILSKRLDKITLEKIAKKYKLTDERIRQIEEEGLAKFLKKACQLLLFD